MSVINIYDVQIAWPRSDSYTSCSISPGPQESSVIWQNTEKYNEGKVVVKDMFLV